MNTKEGILISIKYIAMVCVLVVVIGFSGVKQSDRVVKDVVVNIDNQFENYFIDQSDVYELVHETGKSYLLNLDLGAVNLREIENKIEAHRFVDDADVYRDLDGRLTIDVRQNRPIARILNPSGKDKYIGSTGLILPESSHYTARVLLINKHPRVKFSIENIQETEEGKKLYALIKYIENDPFWKAQIAGIDIDENYEITINPQVTKQLVVFGSPEDYENKLRRLKVFYKEVLPYEGWNSYSEVNLKYKNQIVCK